MALVSSVVADVVTEVLRAAHAETSRKLPLSKTRLHELLALYEGRLTMDDIGGYDTGVVFRFSGKRRVEAPSEPRIVAGRVQGRYGFESEAICPTPSELRARGGLNRFWLRVEKRRMVLQGWADEFYAARD